MPLIVHHPQQASDRATLLDISKNLPNWPKHFVFPTLNPNYTPTPNTTYLLIIAPVLAVITITVVTLRLWTRWRSNFGSDDWVIAFAFIQYLHELFWVVSEHLTRCSVLHLFLRLLSVSYKWPRRYIRTLLVLSYAFIFVNIYFLMFECRPLAGSFDIKIRYLPGRCPDATNLATYAGLCLGHMALDVLTILPPFFIVGRLRMSRARKMNLFALLSFGFLSVMMSGIRIFVFGRSMVHNYDPTRDSVAIGFCGILGNSLALTVASLPALNHSALQKFSIFRAKMSSNASTSAVPRPPIRTKFHSGPINTSESPYQRSQSKSGPCDSLTSNNAIPTYREIDVRPEKYDSDTELVQRTESLTTHPCEQITIDDQWVSLQEMLAGSDKPCVVADHV